MSIFKIVEYVVWCNEKDCHTCYKDDTSATAAYRFRDEGIARNVAIDDGWVYVVTKEKEEQMYCPEHAQDLKTYVKSYGIGATDAKD